MSGRRTKRFWGITIAAATGVAATLALGAWQLGRAHDKLALQAAMTARKSMPPITQAQLLSSQSVGELLHRAIVLRGTWVARHTVFLDNRQMRGKPGFYVVTPLKLEGSARSVLVERGWVQRNFVEREKLPVIDTPAGVVAVAGHMAPPPAKLYEFAPGSSGIIRQNLDWSQFRAETGLDLLELAVQQTGASTEGLLREWPEVASGVEKHYGYTFQWWALSGLIAFLYVWFQFIAPRRRASRG